MKKFTYETAEVKYTINKNNNQYDVEIYFKNLDETEKDILQIKEMEMQGENYFVFIQLPPLTGINKLYDLRERSIQELLNSYEEFLENY